MATSTVRFSACASFIARPQQFIDTAKGIETIAIRQAVRKRIDVSVRTIRVVETIAIGPFLDRLAKK
jgi:hypothetical protein